MPALGGLSVLVAVAILSAIGYRVMIDVKPDVTRPVLDPAARAEIEAATTPSHLPSGAGETMLASERAKRRVKNLAERARRTSRVLVVDEEEERDNGGHETLFSWQAASEKRRRLDERVYAETPPPKAQFRP